jgi:outer membrane lipoprotein-sorting protein
MRSMAWAVVLLAIAASVGAQSPSSDAILARVDANIGSDNKVTLARMVVEGRGVTRTVELRSWIRGTRESFTEYLAPPRDRGTKMLKLGDQLWTYFPESDRTIRISGHMLRQSVMGSDLSYEDLMEDPRLGEAYTARLAGEETHGDRPCWVLELTAKEPGIAYQSRKVWVDKTHDVALREDRFAKGGKLLKTTDVLAVERMNGRWVAKAVVFKDVLKTGRGTRFEIETIEFNASIPDYTFSKAMLRK